jgi:hypothetical protein
MQKYQKNNRNHQSQSISVMATLAAAKSCILGIGGELRTLARNEIIKCER